MTGAYVGLGVLFVLIAVCLVWIQHSGGPVSPDGGEDG